MKSGMSLIELLVTMAIIMLLLVVGVPGYRNYSYSNDLDQAAQDVKNAILETKNMALAPAADKLSTTSVWECLSWGGGWFSHFCVAYGDVSHSADSYMVGIYSQNSSADMGRMIISYASSEITETSPNANSIIKDFKLPSSVNFQQWWGIKFSIADQGKITFASAGGPDGDDVVLEIKNTKLSSNNARTITINKITGQVSISR